MKELDIAQMEQIEGSNWDAILCGLAFDQLGFWNGLAFGLAGFSGAGLFIGLGIAITGTVACALIVS
jgi:hypothetical protein